MRFVALIAAMVAWALPSPATSHTILDQGFWSVSRDNSPGGRELGHIGGGPYILHITGPNDPTATVFIHTWVWALVYDPVTDEYSEPGFDLIWEDSLADGFASLHMPDLGGAAHLDDPVIKIKNVSREWADYYFTIYAVSSVPEPAAWAMILAGFGLVGGAHRRRRLTRLPASRHRAQGT